VSSCRDRELIDPYDHWARVRERVVSANRRIKHKEGRGEVDGTGEDDITCERDEETTGVMSQALARE